MSDTEATIKFLPQKMLSQRKGCDLCKGDLPTQLFIYSSRKTSPFRAGI